MLSVRMSVSTMLSSLPRLSSGSGSPCSHVAGGGVEEVVEPLVGAAITDAVYNFRYSLDSQIIWKYDTL